MSIHCGYVGFWSQFAIRTRGWGGIMANLEWRDSYLTGYPEIDHDHQDILCRCQRLRAVIGNADFTGEDLHERFNSIFTLFCDHFDREERLLVRLESPNLAAHREAHVELLEELVKRLEQLNFNRFDLQSFLDFMERWSVRHVVAIDVPDLRVSGRADYSR